MRGGEGEEDDARGERARAPPPLPPPSPPPTPSSPGCSLISARTSASPLAAFFASMAANFWTEDFIPTSSASAEDACLAFLAALPDSESLGALILCCVREREGRSVVVGWAM